jgi:RNA polymerase sigma-70 factor (family 1)
MEEDIIKWYIKELRNGSHNAFNAIYDMYVDKLYAFVLAHTKSSDLSKDIVQDTFLKLWTMRGDISPDGSFVSFLFTICNHKMIDSFRSQINKVEFEDYIMYTESAEFAENSVERKVFYDEFVQAFKISKKLLPNRQLEIFELSREKGLTVTEIANSLGLSEQTVKNHLTTSLKTIRRELSKYNLLFLILFEICYRA